MVYMVPVWFSWSQRVSDRSIPWLSWSQSGSDREIQCFHVPGWFSWSQSRSDRQLPWFSWSRSGSGCPSDPDRVLDRLQSGLGRRKPWVSWCQRSQHGHFSPHLYVFYGVKEANRALVEKNNVFHDCKEANMVVLVDSCMVFMVSRRPT